MIFSNSSAVKSYLFILGINIFFYINNITINYFFKAFKKIVKLDFNWFIQVPILVKLYIFHFIFLS